MASAGGDSSGEECGLQIDVGKADGRQSKPRGKGAKVTKAVEVSWKPGDIVWAKVSGFNYWPAKVRTGAMAAPGEKLLGGDHPMMIRLWTFSEYSCSLDTCTCDCVLMDGV